MRRKVEIETAFAPTDSLDTCDSFYLLGIGGSGMSALARMFYQRGFAISGADAVASDETERLTNEGIPVVIGHQAEAFEAFLNDQSGSCALVASDAIELSNSPEVRIARARGVPIVRRSQALGWMLRGYRVIAITGTHGKTTTTGMLGAGLIASGVDPLVVAGANIPQWGGPVREGAGEFAVVEACEAYDSYHDIEPFIVVLTNLEPDHLDYHGSYENLRDSMVRFVGSVPPEGGLVYCADDRGASEVAELTDVKTLPYGLTEAWLQLVSNKFELGIDAKTTVAARQLELNLPGDHNRMNATAALAAASLLNTEELIVDLDLVEQGIARFTGAERRLQMIQDGPITIIDDYAHHPSEISASILALRERYADRRLVVVYQPHLYSRTKMLYREFAEALSLADHVVLTDIYPAREAPIPGVSSARIAELLHKPVHYVPSRHLLPREVRKIVQSGDVVVAMGAGTISEFAHDFIDELARDLSQATTLRVAVLYGGDSAEREVSLHSGISVANALRNIGHDVELVDMTDLLLRRGALHGFIGNNRPDVVFLAVHGTHAEDGAIQGLLELLHIPYTGSKIQSSAICMDKALTKEILARHGIQVPLGQQVHSVNEAVTVPLPVVVKPNAQGSTVGLSFCRTEEELRKGIENALQYDESVLIEQWLIGMEISTPVLCGEALPPVEIAPASGVYNFESKYTPGATEEIVPARLPGHVLENAKSIALRAHQVLGCRGATRTDAIVVGENIYVLEVNTLPGMTQTSLLPNSAKGAGLTYEEICQRQIEEAIGLRPEQ